MVDLVVAVQPPPNARAGMTLYPPVAARLQSATNLFDQLGGYWAVATLVHYSGETLHDRLGGRVSDSAHPMPASMHGSSSSSSHSNSGEDRAYFYFPGLVIPEAGRYCIRISLLQMDYSSEDAPEGVVIVRAYADTDWIDVGDSPVSETRPSKLLYCYRGQADQRIGSRERHFLRKLKDDGQRIPTASS
jgi:hypothetical protein